MAQLNLAITIPDELFTAMLSHAQEQGTSISEMLAPAIVSASQAWIGKTPTVQAAQAAKDAADLAAAQAGQQVLQARANWNITVSVLP